MSSIPKHLQGVLWSADVTQLHTQRDAPYIVHQILSYGRFAEIEWLFANYPRSQIKEIFLTQPYKDYHAPRFNFVKNYLLDLKHQVINERRYVKNIPRDLG